MKMKIDDATKGGRNNIKYKGKPMCQQKQAQKNSASNKG